MGLLGDIGRAGGVVTPLVNDAIGLKRQFMQDDRLQAQEARQAETHQHEMNKYRFAEEDRARTEKKSKEVEAILRSTTNIRTIPRIAELPSDLQDDIVNTLKGMRTAEGEPVIDEAGNGTIFNMMHGVEALLTKFPDYTDKIKDGYNRTYSEQIRALQEKAQKATTEEDKAKIYEQMRAVGAVQASRSGDMTNLSRLLRDHNNTGTPAHYVNSQTGEYAGAYAPNRQPAGTEPTSIYNARHKQTKETPLNSVRQQALHKGVESLKPEARAILYGADPLYKKAVDAVNKEIEGGQITELYSSDMSEEVRRAIVYKKIMQKYKTYLGQSADGDIAGIL